MISEPIKIEVKYETKDIWSACFQRFFSRSGLFYTFFGFFIFANTLIILFFNLAEINQLYLLIFTFAYTLFWLFVLTYFSARPYKDTFSFIFSNESIEFISDGYKTKINWSYFSSAKESFKLLNFVMQNGQTFSVPLRNVEPEKLVGIRKLVKDKLGENAKLKEAKNNLGLR
jgi:hypothetical protein